MSIHDSLGIKVGTDENNLDTHTFRTTSDSLGAAVPLYSGIIEAPWEGLYDKLGQIYWRADTPLPLTVVFVAPHVVTQDR